MKSDPRVNAERRNDICRFIADYTEKNSKSPSLREIAAEIGISLSAVHGYLFRMKRDGLLRYDEFMWRTLTVSNQDG